jgi:hypothetical protein
LIDLKRFSFRITFLVENFGPLLAKQYKRESLAIKLLNLPYSGIIIQKPIKKSGRRAGRLALG